MRALTLEEWKILNGLLPTPFAIDDFKIIFNISDEEYVFVENSTGISNEDGSIELTFIDYEGDGIRIIVKEDEVTHIYAL